MASLAAGTGLSQAIVIAVSPILTRLYGPEEFGIFVTFSSVVAIVNVVSSLRYEMAIPLPRVNVEAINLVALSLLLVTAVSLLVFSVSHATYFQSLAAVQALPPHTLPVLLGLGVLTTGANTTIRYWFIRRKNFRRVATNNVIQSFSQAACQVLASSLGAIGLIVGYLVGTLASLSVLLPGFLKGLPRRRSLCRASRMRYAAVRHRQFPLYSTWAALLNSAGNQGMPIMIAFLFSPATAGLYALAYRVLMSPVRVMGEALAQVFFAESASARDAQHLKNTVVQFLEFLVSVSFPLSTLCFAALPSVFRLVFGEQWAEAGVYARLLVPALLIQFIFSPLSMLTAVLRKQQYSLLHQALLVVMRVLAILVGWRFDSIVLALALYSVLTCLVRSTVVIWLVSHVGVKWRDLLRMSLRELALGCAFGVPIFVLSLVTKSDLAVFAATMVAGGLIAARMAISYRRASAAAGGR